MAASLAALQQLQTGNVVRSSSLSRVHRERLIQNDFLLEAVKGWYVVIRPALNDGSSTPWFSSYWTFIAAYLHDRYGDDYCLSSESSLHLHTAATLVPRQLVVISRAKGSQKLKLPFDTSLLIYQDSNNFPTGRTRVNNLWIMDLPTSLCKVAPSFFRQNAIEAELALRMVRDASDILRVLLESGSSAAARRLAGAYQFLGEALMAERIIKDMSSVGYTVKPVNPFAGTAPLLSSGVRIQSPYVARIESLWKTMRGDVADAFPAPPGMQGDPFDYLLRVDEIYVNDAYNSLSIEGYQVTPELIGQIRDGKWDPDINESDRQHRNALAAKGYNLAFRAVKESIQKIFDGVEPAQVVAADHRDWYSRMFAPAVQAGILKPSDLAGYRNQPVYIKGSQHVPLPQTAIVDCMEVLFRLIAEEPHAGVRAVLGHFIFVFIHPYPDGNGRIGRFLLNTLLASGGYPWTVIRLTRRNQYISALEEASTAGRISALARFIAEEMTQI